MAPIVTVFLGTGKDTGHVGLALRNSPILEFGDQLTPAVTMSPEQARIVGCNLIDLASRAERGVKV